MGHQTCIFNLIISPYQVTEIPTKSTLDVTTTVSNVKNLHTSSFQPSNKSSVLEDLLFDNTIASTTMQTNANIELELHFLVWLILICTSGRSLQYTHERWIKALPFL